MESPNGPWSLYHSRKRHPSRQSNKHCWLPRRSLFLPTGSQQHDLDTFPVLLSPLTWSFVNGLLGFAGVVCFFFAFFPFTSSLLRLEFSLRLFGALRPLLLRRLTLAEFPSSNCDSSSSSSSSSAASSDVKLFSERLTAKLRLLSYRLAVKWS